LSGRRNIELWLNSKGIVNWQYSWANGGRFIADVPNDFDVSILSQWGTVIVIPNDE
jgi:hypothetical protein